MADLLVILNTCHDIIYEQAFNSNEKEYCTMILTAYASIDLLDEVKFLDTNFFFSIDKQFCWNVSVCFLCNGFVFLFINCYDEKQSEKFLAEVENVFAEKMLRYDFFEDNLIENDDEFDSKIFSIYCNICKQTK